VRPARLRKKKGECCLQHTDKKKKKKLEGKDGVTISALTIPLNFSLSFVFG